MSFKEFIKLLTGPSTRFHKKFNAERAAAATIIGEEKVQHEIDVARDYLRGDPEFDDTKGQMCCGCCGKDRTTPGPCGGLCAPAGNFVDPGKSIRLSIVTELLSSRLQICKNMEEVCRQDGDAKFVYGWGCRRVEVEDLITFLDRLPL